MIGDTPQDEGQESISHARRRFTSPPARAVRAAYFSGTMYYSSPTAFSTSRTKLHMASQCKAAAKPRDILRHKRYFRDIFAPALKYRQLSPDDGYMHEGYYEAPRYLIRLINRRAAS